MSTTASCLNLKSPIEIENNALTSKTTLHFNCQLSKQCTRPRFLLVLATIVSVVFIFIGLVSLLALTRVLPPSFSSLHALSALQMPGSLTFLMIGSLGIIGCISAPLLNQRQRKLRLQEQQENLMRRRQELRKNESFVMSQTHHTQFMKLQQNREQLNTLLTEEERKNNDGMYVVHRGPKNLTCYVAASGKPTTFKLPMNQEVDITLKNILVEYGSRLVNLTDRVDLNTFFS